MSGGSLNYFYSQLDSHVGDFNDKELDTLVADLAQLFHDREWYLSGDTGIGDWRESRDSFKKKWFTAHGRQKRIEQYLREFCDEIRESFGINETYCKNCKHWTPKGGASRYGKCNYEKTCLMHRSEYCEKYEGKGSYDDD